uniref:Anaphase-promoting complex subunit 4 n=1 Tax=Ornithodoros turicata TaxID=34597 RepID=A0A2R5LB43_9ACAR
MTSFRQIEERHVPAEVAFMLWSPKLDLIALALVQGEVALHRLSWKRVWLRPPPGGKENKTAVQSLAWRPDGKLLAIAYDTGSITLCSVENADVIHTLEVKACVSALTWVSNGCIAQNHETPCSIYNDLSHIYLSKLPSLNKSYGTSSGKLCSENVEDSKKLKDQEDFNILVVGTTTGKVLMHSYGVFLCGEFELDIGTYNRNQAPTIVSAALSEDFGQLSLVVEWDEGAGKCLCLQNYSVPLLQKKSRELQVVALKYGQISSLLSYLSSTIMAITEAWEDILLEIDSKLAKYAQEKQQLSNGTVSDDFLELLMFGTPSDVLEKFLLHDLTDKGLKKLGHSVELCYCNIQKHILKNLQSVGHSLYFHFLDLQGMARWDEKFGALGLSKEAVTCALKSTGAFLMKSMELLQVIDSSMKNFKAFFRWLYTVILRLSDEPVPSEVTRVTQQDISFVANFLTESFAVEWDENKSSSFSLERVGQYLKDEQLPFPPLGQNDWIRFLESAQGFDSDLLVPHDPRKSLVQQHKELEEASNDAFVGPAEVLAKNVARQTQVLLAVTKTKHSVVSQLMSPKERCIYTAVAPDSMCRRDIYLFRGGADEGCVEVVRLVIGNLRDATPADHDQAVVRDCRNTVLDLQLYSADILSILLSETTPSGEQSVPILVQFPMKHILPFFRQVTKQASAYDAVTERDLPAVDIAQFLDKLNYRRLENVKASAFAVSGARSVACVLFQSRRRVRLFEMDVEEEEEEQNLERSPAKEVLDPEMSDLQDEDKENSF